MKYVIVFNGFILILNLLIIHSFIVHFSNKNGQQTLSGLKSMTGSIVFDSDLYDMHNVSIITLFKMNLTLFLSSLGLTTAYGLCYLIDINCRSNFFSNIDKLQDLILQSY